MDDPIGDHVDHQGEGANPAGADHDGRPGKTPSGLAGGALSPSCS
jgi:hypothetical protein